MSVVISVKDEEENVLPVTAELVAALDGRLRYEVVYVDDGSRDATPERLREAALRWPVVRVLSHRRNRGKSAGLITGAQAARARWVVTMDGDGQNEPAAVLALYEEARRREVPGRPLLVAGCRSRRCDTWAKRVGSRLANLMRARLLGDDAPDSACGLKAFRRDDFLVLPRFQNMHRFLPALIRRERGEAVSVTVEDRPRMAGRSKYGLRDRLWAGIADLTGVWWLQRRGLPPDDPADSGGERT